jgi:archaellum component FlaC
MLNPQAPPPSAPQAPVITNEPGTNLFTVTAPLTARDIEAIKARREELSDQLTAASGRRSRLAEQLNKSTNETARQGLEERIAILDKRMVQLETDIAATGQQLTSAPAGLLAATEASSTFMPGLGSGQVTAVSIVFTVAVLGPIAIGMARMMWKRSNRPVLPAGFTETAQRLERLEQSVDTIAIEIERVSEGQRFVTKLLSEGQHEPALGAGKRPETISARSQ